MNWEELLNIGIEARKLRDRANWILGDLALHVETHHKEHTLEAYSDAIGVAYSSLKLYRWVASCFEPAKRLTNLSWSHHLVVAARDDRLEWLSRAEAGKWSVRQLRSEVSAEEAKAATSKLQVAIAQTLGASAEGKEGVAKKLLQVAEQQVQEASKVIHSIPESTPQREVAAKKLKVAEATLKESVAATLATKGGSVFKPKPVGLTELDPSDAYIKKSLLWSEGVTLEAEIQDFLSNQLRRATPELIVSLNSNMREVLRGLIRRAIERLEKVEKALTILAGESLTVQSEGHAVLEEANPELD